MRFTQFLVRNFKGIEELSFKLEKSINANVYTLVGLNESGKTTILEAINLFNNPSKVLGVLEDLPGSTIKDFNTIIPVTKRDNFNEKISISATLKLDSTDLNEINKYVNKHTKFKSILPTNIITFSKHYQYKDSKYLNSSASWSGLQGILKIPENIRQKNKAISIFEKQYQDDHNVIYQYCRNLVPSIIYFPNFLFDFPAKIYLELSDPAIAKEKFYLELVQDILDSLENNINIETHLLERIKSEEKNDKRNLNTILLKMGNKITEVVFNAWNQIFTKEFKDTKVIVEASVDEEKRVYIEFSIEAQGGIYLINERSLGFRWFFTFLLFTQFRQMTKEKNKNILFLFDEPASNLHSNAQQQLLKSFSNLTLNSKVIYTTHSHHMINPAWLESTYVVMNSGMSLDPSENNFRRKNNISIEPYKEFVVNHPHNTTYFQPILDVLDYVPSNLEIIPKCAFLEGKNDYYTLKYFNDVILENPININMAPSTGAGNLDTLISLYMGWGKEFIIILDSDAEGNTQKRRYIDGFGLVVEESIFNLEDIDSSWSNIALEKLFMSDELLKFQQMAFPTSLKYNKKNFNRAIQESLINKNHFTFSDTTISKFEKILKFIDNRFAVPY